MSNRSNNYDRTSENESNQYLPKQQTNRVVEIPVIHCPSSNQNNQSQNSNNNSFQQIHSRPFQNFQQPISVFNSPFDSTINRRPFQEPDLDDFFTPSFTTREPSSLFNRFGSDHLINQRSKISPSSSPNINKRTEPESVSIPVNYEKSPSSLEREQSEQKDIPLSAYKTPNLNASPKPGSYSEKNNQQKQPIFQEQTNRIERSPSPKNIKISQEPQSVFGFNKMGTSNSNLKQTAKAQDQNQSSFVHLAAEAAGFSSSPRSTNPQLKIQRTPQEKIDDIHATLEKLENDVNNYFSPNDKKKDRQFLLLEECLTQCILKLDEINRDDEKINQIRKKLITKAQALIDLLEYRFNNPIKNDSLKINNDNSINENNTLNKSETNNSNEKSSSN